MANHSPPKPKNPRPNPRTRGSGGPRGVPQRVGAAAGCRSDGEGLVHLRLPTKEGVRHLGDAVPAHVRAAVEGVHAVEGLRPRRRLPVGAVLGQPGARGRQVLLLGRVPQVRARAALAQRGAEGLVHMRLRLLEDAAAGGDGRRRRRRPHRWGRRVRHGLGQVHRPAAAGRGGEEPLAAAGAGLADGELLGAGKARRARPGGRGPRAGQLWAGQVQGLVQLVAALVVVAAVRQLEAAVVLGKVLLGQHLVDELVGGQVAQLWDMIPGVAVEGGGQVVSSDGLGAV
mmetsp:Transcript_11244/g.15796  ORF Transcript_11244/g.15796 Transcript_11244/m.15796 type:complete len:285 (-) Transcript_11244:453-1307(-)